MVKEGTEKHRMYSQEFHKTTLKEEPCNPIVIIRSLVPHLRDPFCLGGPYMKDLEHTGESHAARVPSLRETHMGVVVLGWFNLVR